MSIVHEVIRWYFQYRKLEEQIRVYLIDEFVRICSKELPSCSELIDYISEHNYEDFANDNSGQLSLSLNRFKVLEILTFYNSKLPAQILDNKYYINRFHNDKISCQLSVEFKKASWANKLVYIKFDYDIITTDYRKIS